jgi:hypothetical protein
MSPMFGATAIITGTCDDDGKMSPSVVVMTQCLKEITMPTTSDVRMLDEIHVTQQHTKPSISKNNSDSSTLEEATLRARKEEVRISLENKKKALELARSENSKQCDDVSSSSQPMGEHVKLKPINALLETGGIDYIQLSTTQVNFGNHKSCDNDKIRFTDVSVLLPINLGNSTYESTCENDDYNERSIYMSTHKMLNCIIDEHWSEDLKAYYRSGVNYGNGPPAFLRNEYNNHELQFPTSSFDVRYHPQSSNERYADGDGMHSNQVVFDGIALENINRRNFGFSQDIRYSNRLLELEQQRRHQQLLVSNQRSSNAKLGRKHPQQQRQTGSHRDDSRKHHVPKWKDKNNNISTQTSDGSKKQNADNQQKLPQQSHVFDLAQDGRTRWHPNQLSRKPPNSNWRRNNSSNDRGNNGYKRAVLTESHPRVPNHPENIPVNRRGKRSKPDDA